MLPLPNKIFFLQSLLSLCNLKKHNKILIYLFVQHITFHQIPYNFEKHFDLYLITLLEKTSLTEHQNKKMRQLSGGMKRRVGLIQALLNNPDFLIIDEPTTGLDPEERIRIRNLLVDFSKDRTVLFSTHVVEDLAATCTQLAIMKKGSFLYSGSVSGLLENAKGCVWKE